MKRLVYRPKVWAYVKATGGNEPIDISPYLVKGKVDRVVNDVSKAQLTLRNPDFKFTKDQTFHPMDPITIFMARDINYPVRVFTGFLDDTPYLQLFPGTINLTASCTLKRLQYTYWDPALTFSAYFLNQYGWQQTADGSMKNLVAENKRILAKPVGDEIHSSGQQGLNDSGLTSVLSGTMQAVGHWSSKDLLIEPLPPMLTDNIDKLYNDLRKERTETQDALRAFLKKAIGDPPADVATVVGQTDGSTPISGSTGRAPKLPDTAPALVKNLLATADAVAATPTAYVYGGGHDGSPNQLDQAANQYIVDCSSFVSYVMAKNGILQSSSAEVSGWFANNWGESGQGKYMTVWANDSHVFIEFKGTDGSCCVGTTATVDHHSVRWHQHRKDNFIPRRWHGL